MLFQLPLMSALLYLSTPAAALTISEIQGTGFTSPFANKAVVGVSGIVTAIGRAGFWLRNPSPDNDIRTSESIYVFTGTTTSIRENITVGEKITIDGRVEEYRSDKTHLFLTELTGPKNLHRSSLPVLKPEPVRLGQDRSPPTELFSRLDTDMDVFAVPNNASQVESSNLELEPELYGLDFWESLEGELVSIKLPTAISKPNNFRDTWVRGGDWKVTGKNLHGGLTIIPGKDGNGVDANPEAILIGEPLDGTKNPQNIRMGDTLGDITGVVTYAFGFYRILPTTALSVRKQATPASAPPSQLTSDSRCYITFGTYNVENLSPNSAHLRSIAAHIVTFLKSPDLIFLQEIQDDNGPTDSGVVSANRTLTALTDAIYALSNHTTPKYNFIDIPPLNNQDGGQPGGNIRQAYLYNPDTLTLLNPHPVTPETSITPLRVLPGGALSHNPGRINPLSDAWKNSRKPLVAVFIPRNAPAQSKAVPKPLYAINVHFTSKGGSSSIHGSPRPPINGGVSTRLSQAMVVNTFIQDILAKDPTAQVLVAGDFNEFSFVAPMKVFDGTMWDLDQVVNTKVTERYSYLYDMNSQMLDHVLISTSLKDNGRARFEHIHVNSWSTKVDMASDHDPAVANMAICH